MTRLGLLGTFLLLLAVAAAYYDRRPMNPNHILSKRTTKFFVNPVEKETDYWLDVSQKTLYEQLNREEIKGRARNLILFMGDGMSLTTVTAARILNGQLHGKSGEESELFFETFPYLGHSKTYAVDRQVPDSANTATAYLCGVKANYGTIGVNGHVTRKNCTAMNDPGTHVSSLLRWGQLRGKRTGFVTTARVTHASPAGTYANTAERNWESDNNIISDNQDSVLCDDIAEQLIRRETGSNFNVMIGGGRSRFRPKTAKDEEGFKGVREDGVDLIQEWLDKHQGEKTGYVWDKATLEAVDLESVDRLLGLFNPDHLDYELDRDVKKQPSLAELTEAAIRVLDRENGNGFVLFVEGARIDMAHHDSKPMKALYETIEFNLAVERAAQLTSKDDTLSVVTADHGHTLSFSGYPSRGSNILSIAGYSDLDQMPYATLTYANGPGYRLDNGKRHNMNNDNMLDKEYQFPSALPMASETHGGEDVGVFSRGPWAHLLIGTFEESYIPYAMAYAACLSPVEEETCPSPTQEQKYKKYLSDRYRYHHILPTGAPLY